MKGSYIFVITVVLLVGIQLYQPTSAQPPSIVGSDISRNATSNATSNELGNATKEALTNISKNLQQISNISAAATKASVVNSTTIVQSIFDSKLPIVFIVLIFLVLVIPLVFDMYLAYRRRPGEGTGKEGEKRMQGMPGLYRSLMSFGIILLVGTVIF
jgi:Bacterial Ig-like domain